MQAWFATPGSPAKGPAPRGLIGRGGRSEERPSMETALTKRQRRAAKMVTSGAEAAPVALAGAAGWVTDGGEVGGGRAGGLATSGAMMSAGGFACRA